VLKEPFRPVFKAGRRPRLEPSDRSVERAESPAELTLSQYFTAYVDDGQRKLLFPVRHPLRTLRAVDALRALPVHAVPTAPGPDGALIRRLLTRPLLVRLVFRGIASMLVLPQDVSEYLAGGSKRRLREYIHTAGRLGLTYETVESPHQRSELLALADESERTNQVLRWRKEDPQNDDTMPLHTWVLVRAQDGRPLLLTVAAVDGEWAVLRYSRTLVRDKHSAVARYAAMPYLVEHLRAVGVSFLVDPGRPYWLSNGVRQYQRKVGFRLVRLRLCAGTIG
jgi:hypothetical protein